MLARPAEMSIGGLCAGCGTGLNGPAGSWNGERMADASGHETEPEQAELKDKFREALERKKQQHADGVGGRGTQGGKIHETHAQAGTKRQFRRKSGG